MREHGLTEKSAPIAAADQGVGLSRRRRGATVKDCAPKAVYLASGESRFVKKQALSLADGVAI